ncbi:hypothetical protein QCA50_005841 [Cerrena zonata]|uniref:Uncharacterized protein n=1 Tax=Cerrena zonata TaxID=2478898 RepID=A0AAW0GE56_9APHY
MYSLATRSALRRSIAPVSRVSAVAPRYSSTMHDNDPEVLEVEKQRNLKKEQHKTSTPIRNAPNWNEHLASASEAAVKADRSDDTPGELLETTIRYVKKRHHTETETAPTGKAGGKSYASEERFGAEEATYEKEEISGPLRKGSGGSA